jgi:hypothetical protein
MDLHVQHVQRGLPEKAVEIVPAPPSDRVLQNLYFALHSSPLDVTA